MRVNDFAHKEGRGNADADCRMRAEFSGGRDPVKIQQITDAIQSVADVQLLNVDPGRDVNRTVVTFVGPPEAAAEAAFRAIARAAQAIDMRRHHGTHPRIGATDVCPFVPVEGITLEQCRACPAGLASALATSRNPGSIFTERPPCRRIAGIWLTFGPANTSACRQAERPAMETRLRTGRFIQSRARPRSAPRFPGRLQHYA